MAGYALSPQIKTIAEAFLQAGQNTQFRAYGAHPRLHLNAET